jgi:hypothetical protein
MISFTRILVRLWIRDPDFRSLVGLVFLTFLIGTIFYSLHKCDSGGEFEQPDEEGQERRRPRRRYWRRLDYRCLPSSLNRFRGVNP